MVELAATQQAVKEIASLAAQDRQKIDAIDGRLQGVAGEIVMT